MFNSVSDALQQGASQFEQQAGKLKRKFWLQNLKVCIQKQPSSNTLGEDVKKIVQNSRQNYIHMFSTSFTSTMKGEPFKAELILYLPSSLT
jgi:hypothetical protein